MGSDVKPVTVREPEETMEIRRGRVATGVLGTSGVNDRTLGDLTPSESRVCA